jgi:hypothetical protein
VVFADEIQRLLLATGILLASVSGCRLVSLFDTRVKIDNNEVKDDRESHDKPDGDAFTESDVRVNDSECGTSTEPDTRLDADKDSDRYNETDSEASSGIEGDLNCYSDDDLFSDIEMKVEADSAINWDADASGVTDDEYDTGAEETRTFLWRHAAFYVIRSPVERRPNVLVAKLTLLHTKGEDRKPRV